MRESHNMNNDYDETPVHVFDDDDEYESVPIVLADDDDINGSEPSPVKKTDLPNDKSSYSDSFADDGGISFADTVPTTRTEAPAPPPKPAPAPAQTHASQPAPALSYGEEIAPAADFEYDFRQSTVPPSAPPARREERASAHREQIVPPSLEDRAPEQIDGRTVVSGHRGIPSYREGMGKPAIEYPEDSFGAYSTPEDYSATLSQKNAVSSYKDDDDQPLFIFPDDDNEEYSDAREPYEPAAESRAEEKPSARKEPHRTRRKKAEEQWEAEEEPVDEKPIRLSSSTEDGNLSDSIGISFSKYSADNKDSEYFFMPFLDIPDEPEEDDEETEEVGFSFKKVDAEAVKKEKEFIFMPFLNISDEDSEAEEEREGAEHSRRRTSKGTIFDEGLFLIPLESEEEEEEELKVEEEKERAKKEEEEDSGIYVVSAEGGVVPTAPVSPRASSQKRTPQKQEQKQTKQKSKSREPAKSSAPGKKTGAPASSTTKDGKKGKKLTAEEQFRAAMRSVNPEIRAAVKNDPIQRAALEQAVRIALVQQAAQEAVEKSTGRPVFGNYIGGGSSGSTGIMNQKKRPPKPPQQRQGQKQSHMPPQMDGGSHNARGGLNFNPISLRTPFDNTPSEFGASANQPAEFGIDPGIPMAGRQPVGTQQSNAMTSNAGGRQDRNTESGMSQLSHDMNQDPGLAALSPSHDNQGAIDVSQDPVLNSIAQQTGGAKKAAMQSPAAVRAAMRAGADTGGAVTAMTPQIAQQPRTAASAAAEDAQTRRSGCLVWMIVVFIAFFIGIIAIAVVPSFTREMRYQNATTAMTEQDYTEAIKLFEGLSSNANNVYKDSDIKALECVCSLAREYIAREEYESAVSTITGYEQKSVEAANINAESRYLLGLEYFSQQRYADAYETVRTITGYSNEALDLAYRSNYECAMEYYRNEDYAAAAELFGKFEYEDSRSMWSTCKYALAEQYFEAGSQSARATDYYNAYSNYIELGDYGDSEIQSARALYLAQVNRTGTDLFSFNFTEVGNALSILEKNIDGEGIRDIISDPFFYQTKLLGTWNAEQNYITFTQDSNITKFTMAITGVDNCPTSVENTRFAVDGEGFSVRYADDAGEVFYINNAQFDDRYTAKPMSITFICALNGQQYTLTRVE